MRRFAVLTVSAFLGSLLQAAGCLISQTPQIHEPPVTAPFLVPSSASPQPWDVVLFDTSTMPTTSLFVEFKAEVISQDDMTGASPELSSLQSYLLIDYGITWSDGKPYRPQPIPGSTLDAGMLAETTGRWASATWSYSDFYLDPGCHTATLMVSHRWDAQRGCPKCADDVSSITWLLFVCDNTTPAGMPGGCHAFDPTECPSSILTSMPNDCPSYMRDAGEVCPAIEGWSPPQ